jgi:hypothetical protein
MLSTFAYEATGVAETPGIPCALSFLRDVYDAELGHVMPRECGRVSRVVIASAAKQSRTVPPQTQSGLLRRFAPRNDGDAV